MSYNINTVCKNQNIINQDLKIENLIHISEIPIYIVKEIFSNLSYSTLGMAVCLVNKQWKEWGMECLKQKGKKLEGGVVVFDNTNGSGKVVFSAKLKEDCEALSAYEVLINDKQVKNVTDSSYRTGYKRSNSDLDDVSLCFINSQIIHFRYQEKWIKITEVDGSVQTIFYLDPYNFVKEKTYYAYKYIPKEISEQQAKQKIQNMPLDFPSFKGNKAIYNCHGVAVFGYDESKKDYALYWANPYQEKVCEIECSDCGSYRDGGTSLAKSADGQVKFEYYVNLNKRTATHFLNTEKAFLIKI